MTTLESILDHFAKNASEDYHKQIESHDTFDGALRVLRKYSKKHMDVGTDSFQDAEEISRKHYTGPMETVEDLWLLMVYKNDLRIDGPRLGSPSFPTTPSYTSGAAPPKKKKKHFGAYKKGHFRPYKKKGFGLITPGAGKFVVAPYRAKNAYIWDKRSNRKYKAELTGDGRVNFVRFNFTKKFLATITETGVPGFAVTWDLQSDEVPNDLLFSMIFKDRNKDLVDWAMALIESGDIKIAKDSATAGFVPAKLVGSNISSMRLSKPLSKRYLEGKRFKFDPRSKDVYWEPTDGPYLMKVVVTNGRHNTFKRVLVTSIKHSGRLKTCTVQQLVKRFA